MNGIFIFVLIIGVVVLIIGYIVAIASKRGELAMISIFFADKRSITADAKEFLKRNNYHNTAYNQKMLESFQVYRIVKHQNEDDPCQH